jgi:hypothetical protein
VPDGLRTMTDFAVAKYVFLATYGLWFALALGYLLIKLLQENDYDD